MPMTKTVLDKNQANALLKELFKQFTTCCQRNTPPTAVDFHRCLSPRLHLTSNGHVAAKSLSDYLNRVSKFQKKYDRIELLNPKEIMTCDNKIIVRYDAYLTPKNGGSKHVINILAIATVEDDLITHWEQVAHEQGTGQWDK